MREKHLPLLLLFPAFFLMSFLTLFPALYAIYTSFHQYNVIYPERGFKFIGLNNYLNILFDYNVGNSTYLTVLFTVVVVIVEFILGLTIALLLDRELRGLKIIRSLIMIPTILTPVVVALSWRLILNAHFGILNYILASIGFPQPDWLGNRAVAIWSVMLVDIWQWTPFIFLIMFASLRALPTEPYEAAMIDRASKLQQLRYITLPMLKTVMSIAILLRFVDAIRIFDVPYVLTHGGPALGSDVFSLLIYRNAFKFWEIGYATSLSLAFLLTVLITVFFYLQFTKLKF